ncbi:hypothetical protein [Clostridium sp.]
MSSYNKSEEDGLVSLLEKKSVVRRIYGLDMVIKNIPEMLVLMVL